MKNVTLSFDDEQRCNAAIYEGLQNEILAKGFDSPWSFIFVWACFVSGLQHACTIFWPLNHFETSFFPPSSDQLMEMHHVGILFFLRFQMASMTLCFLKITENKKIVCVWIITLFLEKTRILSVANTVSWPLLYNQ